MALSLLPLLFLHAGAQLWDDECEGHCALNVLQTRALSLAEGPFMTEADTKETQNVSMEDLGTDELERLVARAQSELEKRGSSEDLGGAFDPEAFEEMPDETIGHQEGMAVGNDTEGVDIDVDMDTAVDASGAKAKVMSGACGNGKYFGNSPKELCFCKLAGNAGCASKQCTCPQGCGGSVVWKSGGSVTFKNRARAHGCKPSTVLLTAPKAYYGTPADLKRCPNAVSVIAMLLRDSWRLYQSRVGRGSMNQCFHGSRTASVKYLHLQSFCSYATFHAMPNNNHAVGVCVKMSSINEANSLARKLYSQMQ